MKKKITHDLFKVFSVKHILSLLIMLLSLSTFAAHKKTSPHTLAIQITGVVTDENNQPLPGVNVRVKNTTVGTSTDANGKYTISAEPGSTLVYSFIGYLHLKRLLLQRQL
jgi:hypothetical protein